MPVEALSTVSIRISGYLPTRAITLRRTPETSVGVDYAFPSFGQKIIDEETPPDNKIPIVETGNGGDHQNWAIHFDAVEVFQGQPGFHSPYQGPQSPSPDDYFRQTSEADLFFAARVWPGGEIYFNPEYYQGFGFGETLGLAAFPNAMAYKVGKFCGDFNIPHLFFRQVWGLEANRSSSMLTNCNLPKKWTSPG
jgi:hypothetical protein